MKSRVILTFGNSQLGKSSFINTLKGETASEVGRGGVSKTKNILAYEVGASKMLFENDPDDSRLFIIDIPGFQDSEMTILDKNIVKLITCELLKLEQDYIDLILLFESAISSTISIRRTLDIMLNAFGDHILDSTVGLVTKWDLLDENEAKLKRNALSTFNKFPLVEWVNDTGSKKISSELKTSQLRVLSDSIKGKSFYKINNIEKFKEEIVALGIKMRDEDPDRYEIKTEAFLVKVNDSITVNEEYSEYEKRNKTEEEILVRAEELRIDAGTYAVQKSRLINQEYDEEYNEIEYRPFQVYVEKNRGFFRSTKGWFETRYNQVLVTKTRRGSRQVLEQYIDYEYYPIENFLNKAINETQEVTKNREKIVDVIREEIATKEVKCEKHDFSFYNEKAILEIEKKFRVLINQ